MIDGVKIINLRKINDERGMVMHMLKRTDGHFIEFGEIYFSCGFPNIIKAWHVHKEMTLNNCCIVGMIKLVLYDDRNHSKTKGELQEIILSTDEHRVITVPPLIWNGFKVIGEDYSIVANCSDIPHDPNEIKRRNFNDKYIPYKW